MNVWKVLNLLGFESSFDDYLQYQIFNLKVFQINLNYEF